MTRGDEMRLSFVIPVKDEEQSLRTLYSEILENIPSYEYEIIFIDDGSKDNSYNEIKNICEIDENVSVIHFRKNFGKSEALNRGFRKVTGDIVFTMDADLQDNPSDIPTFIKKINEGYDLVNGWKVKRVDPFTKTIPSKIFNFITSICCGLKLHDYNCGYKAYKREVLYEIDVYGELHRYIPALVASKGFTIAEIPVNHRARRFGKSKYGCKRFLRGYLDLMTVLLVTRFNRSPLYLFGGIGSLSLGIGFLLGIYLTILRVCKLIYLSNRPILFLAILLIIVGLQFISIGLIGELLVNQARKLNRNDYSSVKR